MSAWRLMRENGISYLVSGPSAHISEAESISEILADDNVILWRRGFQPLCVLFSIQPLPNHKIWGNLWIGGQDAHALFEITVPQSHFDIFEQLRNEDALPAECMLLINRMPSRLDGCVLDTFYDFALLRWSVEIPLLFDKDMDSRFPRNAPNRDD